MAVFTPGGIDIGVAALQFSCFFVMSQYRGGRLRIWWFLCGSLKPGCEDMEDVMSQFWGGRLRMSELLCNSFEQRCESQFWGGRLRL